MPNKPTSSRSTDAINRRRRTLHNVIEFPEASGAWDAGLMIVFELDARFAIDPNVPEMNQKPAEVISILKKRRGKAGHARARSDD